MTKLLVGIAGLTACLLLGGCNSLGSSTSNQTGAEAPPGSKRIALISKAVGADYWTSVGEGALAAGHELGYEVTFNGPDTESESDKQLNMLQTAINDAPAGVGFAPQDGAQDGGPDLLQEAADKSIPSIVFDTPLGGSDVPVATVASDNAGMGAQAAEHLVELIGAEGKVAIIAHGEIGSAALRRDGFVEWLADNAPKVEVVSVQNGESDPAKSRDKAQGILQAHPDLVGFYGTDDDSTIAAADEVAGRGGSVAVVGVDTSPDVMTLLNDGKISGVVSQNPYNMGYQTVQVLVAAIEGTAPTEKSIVSQSVWVTKDNQDTEEVKQVLGTS